MSSIGAITKLIENLGDDIQSNETLIQSNEKLIITLILFVGVNALLTGVTIFFNFRLKNKEKGIKSHSVREQGRMKHQATLYEMLEDLSNIDKTTKNNYLKKTTLINQFLTSKKIYLTKDTIKIATEINDYFLSLISDYRKRDFNTELKLMDKYSDAFNA
jgi:t-SNARE complex subunit (syntaxin)